MTRECGPCTACCTTIGVQALEKPVQRTCHHLGLVPRVSLEPGHVSVVRPGCTIYPTRPAECAGFVCAWLSGLLRDGDRPDVLGVILTAGDTLLKQDLDIDSLLALEARDGALDEPATRAALRRLARERVLVLVDFGQVQRIVGPPAEIERVRQWNERQGAK